MTTKIVIKNKCVGSQHNIPPPLRPRLNVCDRQTDVRHASSLNARECKRHKTASSSSSHESFATEKELTQVTLIETVA